MRKSNIRVSSGGKMGGLSTARTSRIQQVDGPPDPVSSIRIMRINFWRLIPAQPTVPGSKTLGPPLPLISEMARSIGLSAPVSQFLASSERLLATNRCYNSRRHDRNQENSVQP